MKMIKFIIVDDNPTFRESLRFYLENILDYRVLAEFENGKEFLSGESYYEADIILMDIEMPEMNGLDSIKLAQQDYQFVKAIAITSYEERAYLDELLKMGFKGCVLKSDVFKQLEKAITQVMDGRYYFPKNIKTTTNQ